ncbi:MAG TPA: GFA family protein [Solirubrobacteraceae bacterium]|nr:GFA family protein [Solirubrobacteraceae bacterium]
MADREASRSCGQLVATVVGDPRRISICHCLACQRRTGSAFGVQSRFDRDQVRITGTSHAYTRVSDEGEERTTHFCPECGATVIIASNSTPDTLGIPVGAFADPAFPAPTVSVWEDRMHHWVELPPGIQHLD